MFQLAEQVREAERDEAEIRVVHADEFMQITFPPRENILGEWLPRQGLAMVYASRGTGKTWVSLSIAYAVASGGSLFGWKASRAKSVLFLDGEMPAVTLQERLSRIAAAGGVRIEAPLRIVTPDLQKAGMIDLSRAEDQDALEAHLADTDLIIVDNLSSLCRSVRENEAEGWVPVQQWALKQRSVGRSVLFIHHAGKNGTQRGTSRREDVLDSVIVLRRSGDYTPEQGACFEVHFEKSRGIYGDAVRPFEARLICEGDEHLHWEVKPLEISTAEKVARLLQEGISQQEISELLKISKGAVSKAKKKALGLGLCRE